MVLTGNESLCNKPLNEQKTSLIQITIQERSETSTWTLSFEYAHCTDRGKKSWDRTSLFQRLPIHPLYFRVHSSITQLAAFKYFIVYK